MKYTQNTLDKIERILDEMEYVVRYERGNFQSGYCILEQRKVVVLNKFLQMEGRINTLMDIIPQLKIEPSHLSPEARKTYDEIIARKEAENNEEEEGKGTGSGINDAPVADEGQKNTERNE